MVVTNMYPPTANDSPAIMSSPARTRAAQSPAARIACATVPGPLCGFAGEGRTPITLLDTRENRTIRTCMPGDLGGGLSNDVRHDQKKVGVAGFLCGCGQQSMRLAPVVCLVVEEMGDEKPLRSTDLA
jgi:hypothetical protein